MENQKTRKQENHNDEGEGRQDRHGNEFRKNVFPKPKASRLGTNLIACDVEGKLENNVNWAEVDAVEALIEELLRAGYCFNSPDSDNTIGVISPYRRQVDALTQRLKSRWSDFSPKSIGTVHTFQGGQKSVVIFSTRQCQANDSLWFINHRSNLRGGCCQQSARIVYPGGEFGAKLVRLN